MRASRDGSAMYLAILTLFFLLFKGPFAAVSCNVRNSPGCDGDATRALEDDGKAPFRFNMFSYTVNGAYQWIFDWGPFDLVVKTDLVKFTDVNSQLELEFKAVNTYKVVYGRDGSSVFLASSALTVPAAGTPQQLAAENRLLATLQGANAIAIQDRKLFVAGTQFAAQFDRIPLIEPVVGQEWDGLAVEGNVLKVVPATYFFRGGFSDLYNGGAEFPINVELAMDAEDEVVVVLRYVDVATFRIKYNVADGWVDKVINLGTTSNGATPAQQAVGKKIVDVISNVQQIAFENSYLVQFITDSGATRLSFAFEKNSSVRRLAGTELNVRSIQAESYTVNGQNAQLFVGVPVPIRIEYPDPSVGLANITIIGQATQSFVVRYNNNDGWVISVQIGQSFETVPAPASSDAAAEKTVRDIVATVQQVAFESDGRVQFIKDNGKTRISFTTQDNAVPEAEALQLVPATYVLQGTATNLFGSAAAYPITVTLTPNGVGSVIADLKAINSVRYTYQYNNADGWVESITPGIGTLVIGVNADQQQAEDRIRYIFSSANQLAFETDGRVQFIADFGATRVAFDPTSATTSTTTTTTATTTTSTGSTTTAGTINVVPNTYVLDGVASTLYDGAEFPITVSVLRTGIGAVTITLYAVDTTQYAVQYNNADGWVSNVSRQVIGVGSKSLDQLTTAVKIQNILANLQQIAFEDDGSVQFISTGGSSRIVFAPGTSGSRRLAAADIKSFYVEPATYQTSGAPTVLFSGDAFPVTLTFEVIGVGNAKLTLAGVNTYGFNVTYNNADGWVNSIVATTSTKAVVATQLQQTMDRIVSAVANAQQIAFESDGRVQFISNHGSDRLSFDPVPRSVKRDVQPASYIFRGASAQLFGKENFPITVVTQQLAVGLMQANLTAVNTISYTISYNNADGWVSAVNHTIVAKGVGGTDRQVTEKKIVDILANVQQLGFQNDGSLQFITDSGATRISFGPQNRRRLAAVLTALPETYQINGAPATLYEGPYFPVTFETTSSGVGSMDFVVHAVNTLKYTAKYNAADGWVSSIASAGATRKTGTPDQIATEEKIKSLVAATQQIAFEADGRIQFIGLHGANRITFADHPNPALSVVPETYILKGAKSTLFDGAAFPITVTVVSTGQGVVNATLHAVSTISYKVSYNSDGWVTAITHSTVQKGTGDATQQAAETRVVNIVANTQQIAFESDGRVQFITDNGASRLTFAPANRRRLQATEVRQVVTETYRIGNKAQQLYTTGVTYPATLLTSSAGVGAIDVTLTVVNSYNYRIYYNNADGWVTSVVPGAVTLSVASPAQADVEAKLATIIGNVQQIAFENDGRIQFITNHGADRVAFDPAILQGSSAVNIRTVVPASYVFRGSFAQLFTTDAYPVTIEVSSTVGNLNVTLSAVNRISYSIQYDNANGNVKAVTHSTVSTGAGNAGQLDAETKLKNIIANAQQVQWGTNGSLTFVTDSGSSRITFSPSSRRRLEENGDTMTLLPSSYKLGGNFATLFESGIEATVTAEIETPQSNETSVLVFTLNAAKSTSFTFAYNDAGIVSSVQRFVIDGEVEEEGELTNVEAKIVDVLSATKIITFGADGGLTFTTAGQSEISFAAVKQLVWKRREIAAETYQVDHTAATLFTGEAYPILVDVATTAEGEVEVVLTAVNTLKYIIQYNESDGWVTEITQIEETIITGDTVALEAEMKVKGIIENVQQLAFEEDGRLQFITAHGATRVSFDEPTEVPVHREIVAETYQKNGVNQQLFTGSVYPVSLDSLELEAGNVTITLYSKNTYVYTYVFNTTDGWVKSLTPGLATAIEIPDAEHAAAEQRITALVGGAQQLAFESDGRLQFLASSGADRLSFDLPARRRLAESKPLILLPETYVVNGKHVDFFQGPSFPVTATIETVNVGKITVLFNAVSATRFYINYNNADGWVSLITKSTTARRTGTATQTAAEARALDLIAGTQQLAFEADGRVQFLSNYGANRLVFGAADELFQVLYSTYQYRGNADTLYTGDVFPISVELHRAPGEVNATLNAVGSIVYRIKYNDADGWVNSVTHETLKTGAGTSDQNATQTKLVNILANVQQVAFESDGRVQFITDNGASRITFAAQSTTARRMLRSAVTTEYDVEPMSYVQNGVSLNLFEDVPVFPLTLTVHADGDAENFDVAAVSLWRFTIKRDKSTGAVSAIRVSKISEGTGTDAQVAAEAKAKNLIGNSRVVLVSSNTVTFVTDDYNSRLTFVAKIRPTTRPWLGGEGVTTDAVTLPATNAVKPPATLPATLPVAEVYLVPSLTTSAEAGSFVANGTYLHLFEGESFPITLSLALQDEQTVMAELTAVNTYRYAIKWNPLGGSVNNVTAIFTTNYGGNPVQLNDEAKVVHILANLESLTFSPLQAAVLTADGGATRLLFRGSLERRLQAAIEVGREPHAVVPSSYQVLGQSAQLFAAGTSLNATVVVEVQGVGAVRITLTALGTYVYDFKYNNADGWVNSVTLVSKTTAAGSTDAKAVDQKLNAIIGNTQQIAFESDGRIQFITDDGATRIAFDEGNKIYAVQGNYVPSSTYTANGVVQPLYAGSAFPVALAVINDEVNGVLNVTLSAVNVATYSIKYNLQDGWVTGQANTKAGALVASLDPTWSSTEARITGILENLQQIVFEADGRLTFTAGQGANRITFVKAASSRRLSATRLAVAGSYRLNGADSKLYESSYFPIALDYVQTGVGAATVSVRGLPGMRTYDIKYNNADGWVSSVVLTHSAVGNVPAQQQIAFDRIVSLVSRVQQLGFSNDGTLQIITDNGASRVTFN